MKRSSFLAAIFGLLLASPRKRDDGFPEIAFFKVRTPHGPAVLRFENGILVSAEGAGAAS